MLNDKDMISVYNRSRNGSCSYIIPEMGNLRRVYEPGETKKVPMEELRKLSWIPGGLGVLKKYLIVQNKEAVEELIGPVEPEYYYTKDDIIYLLTQGSMDQLEDCLNFAPEGVIETLREISISIKLNDMNKRKMIQEKTGFNVDRAIRANEEVEAAQAALGATEEKESVKTRKAEPVVAATSSTPTRKATLPTYNVVNK